MLYSPVFKRRKRFLLAYILLIAVFLASGPQFAFALDNAAGDNSNSNPFGVMFGRAEKVSAAKALGARYYRPLPVFADKWDGRCLECDAAVNSGLELVLTVRNNAAPRNPATPPADPESYKRAITEILEKYRPVLLVVENEENSALFYSGDPGQYHEQLRAACAAAHAQGVKCANGGLVSSLVAILVADDYLSRGERDKAQDYLVRTLGPKLSAKRGGQNNDCSLALLETPKAVRQLAKGKALLAGYKEAGADYINFHWYIADTPALSEAIDYLQRVTGLAAITNEVGQQKNMDPGQVTAVMQELRANKIPIAIWFSVDVQDFGQARSLVDADGGLRPNGQAYKSFIENNL
jgi:hypothetical protein